MCGHHTNMHDIHTGSEYSRQSGVGTGRVWAICLSRPISCLHARVHHEDLEYPFVVGLGYAYTLALL